MQLKYKQSSGTDSLYHLMPETIDTQFARQQMEMLSEVRQQLEPAAAVGSSLTDLAVLCFITR